jgi:hypothetical protein
VRFSQQRNSLGLFHRFLLPLVKDRKGYTSLVAGGRLSDGGHMKLEQSFAIPFPRERVWAFLHDTEAVVRSLPGARADR